MTEQEMKVRRLIFNHVRVERTMERVIKELPLFFSDSLSLEYPDFEWPTSLIMKTMTEPLNLKSIDLWHGGTEECGCWHMTGFQINLENGYSSQAESSG